MSDLFSILQPGFEHTRRQRELDKMLIIDARQGGRGPQPLDLESGHVTISLPDRHHPAPGTSSALDSDADAPAPEPDADADDPAP